ncbi:DUF421 domain-containing protein [Amphibacillus sediminis]|uniref:DUF421 domain-containing protein n=1 Tax=Amphibacillus sediminis TaxID=360185 RepID=UPI0008356A56|nr:DUF421 domain-containing protein [Amphibacillus sediminis]
MLMHFTVIFRSIIAFSLLLLGTRILGKQTISQMNMFDFVATISLGSIAANLAFDTSIKMHHNILAFIIFVFVIYLTAYISLKNTRARKLLAGNPTVLIDNGVILKENMKKMRYTLDYLNQQLREKDVFNISEVLFAILETNGTLTVLKKPPFRPIVKQDLAIPTSVESRLAVELIMDGKLLADNLIQNNISEDWLKRELTNRQLKESDVFYAVLSANNHLFVANYDQDLSCPTNQE